MNTLFSFAIGIGTKNAQGKWIEVYYPKPLLNPTSEFLDAARAIGYQNGNTSIELDQSKLNRLSELISDTPQKDIAKTLQSSVQPTVLTVLETDNKPTETTEAYLKLHLLSHRLVKPHQINLEGIFSLLPNIAWTNQGAIDLTELPKRQLEARIKGECLHVDSVDKFPKMSNYIVPQGVRIADTARVRLGAYIGEGTTIMHEGFVNFNAGTEGTSMIEGRISAGVFVGKSSDLGGGSSTMGTLSGGGNMVISIGNQCLIGANAGTGIPLGDRCTIESGLYITAGTKVAVLNDQNKIINTLKARELAGISDLLFRRNSINGTVECLSNKSSIELNEELHKHN